MKGHQMTFNILINYPRNSGNNLSGSILTFGNPPIDASATGVTMSIGRDSEKVKSKKKGKPVGKKDKPSRVEKRLGVERLCHRFVNAQETAILSFMKPFEVNVSSVSGGEKQNVSTLMDLEKSYRAGMERLMERQTELEKSGGDEASVKEIIEMQKELEALHHQVANGYDRIQSEAREKLNAMTGEMPDEEMDNAVQAEVMEELRDIFGSLKKS